MPSGVYKHKPHQTKEHVKSRMDKIRNRKTGKFIKCLICGKSKYKYPRDFNKRGILKGSGKYCSIKCKQLGQKGKRCSIKTEFKKGIKVWNKNLKGIHLSPKSEFKKGREAPKGEKNPNWKGGISRKKHNGDWRYKNWRLGIFKRDSFTCQGCRKIGGYLQAHHIKCWSKYLELRFDIDNGITLCLDCHKLIHKK